MSEVFRYRDYLTDAEHATLTCRYELDGREFSEKVTLPGQERNPRWHTEAAQAAARLVFLLAGVSYYKTAAPPVVDLGHTALTESEQAFLRDFYLHGLGEFAYRNNLDLSQLELRALCRPGGGGGRPPPPPPPRGGGGGGGGGAPPPPGGGGGGGAPPPGQHGSGRRRRARRAVPR
jgi:hypothetical protein